VSIGLQQYLNMLFQHNSVMGNSGNRAIPTRTVGPRFKHSNACYDLNKIFALKIGTKMVKNFAF
jgi:hypothetical protein